MHLIFFAQVYVQLHDLYRRMYGGKRSAIVTQELPSLFFEAESKTEISSSLVTICGLLSREIAMSPCIQR